jgi:hypothetical protein
MTARMCRRMSIALPIVVLTLAAIRPQAARATPSTTFWAPSTPSVQPYGVLHMTYDTYFGRRAAYPIDAGLTMGVLPGKKLQAEIGFDLFYPTFAGSRAVSAPFVLNAKVGSPEDACFKGQPAWSVGIFGIGLEQDVNDQNALYAMLGKTISHLGFAQIGAYYGTNERLFLSATGDEARSGLLAGWASPAIHAPHLDKVVFAWDIQTGHNVLGATGGGAYLYITPAVDLLMGPVYFFEPDLQPGGSRWMWTMQLDVDLDLLSGHTP